ncbi:glycosyltransferase family 2 protein [Roseiflexus sp.]|uniref:glycosyltransferase family 2 protein n=3 Tax=Roseiflexus sp. TaxID=2562120 RepID=UPI00398AC09E
MIDTYRLCVIIPTYNRRGDLVACLSSIAHQSRLPDEVIIVDASTSLVGDEEIIYTKALAPAPLRYMLTRKAGATIQRNQGLALVHQKTTHVMFLDDDVILDGQYCKEILRVFSKKPEIIGVGGWITNPQNPPFGQKFYWLLRLFMIYGKIPGEILPSGFNTPIFIATSNEHFQTKSLEGGNMCVRLDYIRDLRFDTRYERFAGYAYLEDIDFTYTLKQKGELWVTPYAKMKHMVSPISRTREFRFGICQVFNRALFVRKHFGNRLYHWLCFIWSITGIMLTNIAMIAKGRPLDRLLGNIVGLVVTPFELPYLFRKS